MTKQANFVQAVPTVCHQFSSPFVTLLLEAIHLQTMAWKLSVGDNAVGSSFKQHEVARRINQQVRQ